MKTKDQKNDTKHTPGPWRQLVSIGLYGTTVAEAAEQLVCEGLRNDLKRKRINTLEKTEQ